MVLYGTDGNGGLKELYGAEWGQGSDARAWLTGDFTGGGTTEIAQLWDNQGQLGMTFYRTDGKGGLKPWFSNGYIGASSAALRGGWLTGDFTGGGTTEIVQLRDNDSRLAMTLYGTDDNGGLRQLSDNLNMGQGSGALAWLTGDFTGGERTEIAQLWSDNGKLAMILYGTNGKGDLKELFGSEWGQGSDALPGGWLTGDFTGGGTTEIVQLWDNQGQLGITLYGTDGKGGLTQLFRNGNMGASSAALAWLTGDFTGAGAVPTKIVQLWDNKGQLAMSLYGPNGSGGLTQLFINGDMGEGSGASVAYLAGNFTGAWTTEIVQLWNHNSRLAVNLYGCGGNRLIHVTNMLDTGSIEAFNSSFLALNTDDSLSANATTQAAAASLVFTVSEQALYIQCNSKYLKAGKDGSLMAIANSMADGTPFYVYLTEEGNLLLSTTDRRLWRLEDDLKITVASPGPRIDLRNEFMLHLHPVQTHSLLTQRGLQAMDNPSACDLAWASFVWQLTGGMFVALGLGPFIATGEAQTGMLSLLRSNPTILEGLQTAYNAIVNNPGAGAVAGAVVTEVAHDVIVAIYRAGLLWDVVKLALFAAGFWAAFRILFKILEVVLLPEVEAAELLASFTIWIAQTTYSVQKMESNCP